MATSELVEFRCPHDGRLLFKVSDVPGLEVEVKCPRCNEIVKAERKADETEE